MLVVSFFLFFFIMIHLNIPSYNLSFICDCTCPIICKTFIYFDQSDKSFWHTWVWLPKDLVDSSLIGSVENMKPFLNDPTQDVVTYVNVSYTGCRYICECIVHRMSLHMWMYHQRKLYKKDKVKLVLRCHLYDKEKVAL